MLADEPLELTDDVRVAAESEIGLDPALQSEQAQLVEPRDRRLERRLVRDVRERRSSPERECLPQRRGALDGSSRSSAWLPSYASRSNRWRSSAPLDDSQHVRRARESRSPPCRAPCGDPRRSPARGSRRSRAGRRPRDRRSGATPEPRCSAGRGAGRAQRVAWGRRVGPGARRRRPRAGPTGGTRRASADPTPADRPRALPPWLRSVRVAACANGSSSHRPASTSRSACSSFPGRGSERRTYPRRAPAHRRERYAPPRRRAHADAVPALPPLRHRRPARPHVARRRPPAGADLVLDRPARREPGARQPHGRSAQAALLRPARQPRREGDRGRVPGRVEGRLRLLPRPGGGRADSRRHDDRRADAGPTRADRAHVRGDRGGGAGDRPPLQLDLRDAAARRVPPRTGRDHAPRRARRGALQGARRGRPGPRSSSSTRPRASTTPSSSTRSRSARRSRTSGVPRRPPR